jgi:predicted permease
MSSAFAHVNGDYFRALRVELQRGRVFSEQDGPGGPLVAVVSRTLAERAWPGDDAVGKGIRWGGSDEGERIVIGIVDDVKNQSLMETTEPMIYLQTSQHSQSVLTFVFRSQLGTSAAAETLRRVLREMDPQLSTTPPESMKEYAALGLLPQRIATFITAGFGSLALLLSAIGVYGVIAFMVAQRTREIGIRMALGADRTKVVRLVVMNGLRLTAPGAVIGAIAGLGLAFLLRSFILGVPPTDPVTLITAPAVLLAAVLLACWMPAARAAAVEPSRALRAE